MIGEGNHDSPSNAALAGEVEASGRQRRITVAIAERAVMVQTRGGARDVKRAGTGGWVKGARERLSCARHMYDVYATSISHRAPLGCHGTP